MRWALVVLVMLAGTARAGTIKCADTATGDLAIDGVLDDWAKASSVRAGAAGGAIALRCAWDGTALALALDIEDDRVVRVKGHGDEDQVAISVTASGGTPAEISVFPGNPIATAKHKAPPKVLVGDSLQPHGFSIEVLLPVAALKGFGASTPSIQVTVYFHDSDAAVGGKATNVKLDATIELGERKDLLDDFLRTAHLKRSDVKLDAMVALDPDRKGKQRLVAGGNVIGVLTEQFAFVTIDGTPEKVELFPIGPHGSQVIGALVVQAGKSGTRSLLMLWTVWSGQLSQLVQIEVRRSSGNRALASVWRVVGKELIVETKAVAGVTAETWADDAPAGADEILVPWDRKRKAVAYSVKGAEIVRRDVRR